MGKCTLEEFDTTVRKEKHESVEQLMESQGKLELKVAAVEELKKKIKEYKGILRRQVAT